MDVLVRQGKIFYWGTSEWSAADVMRAHGIAQRNGLTPPVMEQPQYNMLWRRRMEVEYLPLFEELGYGTTIWSPLASGVLTDKYNDGVPKGTRLDLPNMKWLAEMVLDEDRVAKVRALAPIAKELGCTMAQLAIAWCLKNKNVSSVITGASRKEQVVENMKRSKANANVGVLLARRLKALDVKLDAKTMKRIDETLGNVPAQDGS